MISNQWRILCQVCSIFCKNPVTLICCYCSHPTFMAYRKMFQSRKWYFFLSKLNELNKNSRSINMLKGPIGSFCWKSDQLCTLLTYSSTLNFFQKFLVIIEVGLIGKNVLLPQSAHICWGSYQITLTRITIQSRAAM